MAHERLHACHHVAVPSSSGSLSRPEAGQTHASDLLKGPPKGSCASGRLLLVGVAGCRLMLMLTHMHAAYTHTHRAAPACHHPAQRVSESLMACRKEHPQQSICTVGLLSTAVEMTHVAVEVT